MSSLFFFFIDFYFVLQVFWWTSQEITALHFTLVLRVWHWEPYFLEWCGQLRLASSAGRKLLRRSRRVRLRGIPH